MIGATLGPYRITAELGAGGMGTVYRATVEHGTGALAPGTTVAVKVVHAHLVARPGFLERFAREEEIGRRVVNENVVRTLDAGTTRSGGADVHYLAMEYVEGRTLRALADDLGCRATVTPDGRVLPGSQGVPEELCRHVGRAVAKGLAAIHAAGIVHRDVKPDNVLITKDHVVKVMDLGVARLDGEAMQLSQSGAFVGSMRYAAPEQFERAGRAIDGRADLHALGLVLFELATATHPFVADDVPGIIDEVLHKSPRRAGDVNPQLSAFFEEVLDTLLAKSRDARFASADELVCVLEEGEESAWWKERASAIRARTRRPLRRIRIPRETSLHGRETELATLRRLYDRASDGEGAILLVEGEAGIGKSRLVDEFVARLERAGEAIHCLVGGYPPGGAATSSGAFSTAYREQFGEEGSARWLSRAPILAPAFDALLRGEPAPAGAEPLTKDSLQTCFVHATQALGADRATVVVIDDLHFATPEGRALFAALALAVRGHRVFLIGTTRPGLDERWLGEIDRIGAARLSLPRLGAPDLVHLLADSLRSRHLAEELAGKIAVKSDGNPFFVFEILRGLREGQFLTKKPDGTWVTTQVIRDIQIPSSIRELVQARVADLDDASRNLLDVAACIGFEFDPATAAAVLGLARVAALQCFAKIEKRSRLVRSTGRNYVFDHHQVQEALYDSLNEQLREEYHAGIAAALEARHDAGSRDPSGLDGALCVQLCEHLLSGSASAGRESGSAAGAARALRYLDAALAHLSANYRNDAAIRLAERALGIPGLLTGRARFDVLLRRAKRLELVGRRTEERACLDEATVLAESVADPALRAHARSATGRHLYLCGEFAASQAVLEEALALARATGDRELEGTVTGQLGVGFYRLGRQDQARALHEQHLALSREAGDVRGEATAIGNLGTVAYMLSRYEEMAAHCRRHLALSREVGDRFGECRATGNLALALASLGRHDDAREMSERHRRLSREIGYRLGEVYAAVNLGDALSALGRNDEALANREWTVALSREIGDRLREAMGLARVGATLDALGDAERAQTRLVAGIAVALEIGDVRIPMEARIELGAIRMRAGDAEGARENFVRAAADAARGGFAGYGALVRCRLACLPGGDATDAVAAFEASQESLSADQRRETRLLLWKATGERAHLAEANRLLGEALDKVPEEHRATMVAGVRVNREIAAEAKAAGLAP